MIIEITIETDRGRRLSKILAYKGEDFDKVVSVTFPENKGESVKMTVREMILSRIRKAGEDMLKQSQQ